MIVHFLFCAATFLIFAYIDSQRGDIKKKKNVYNNLCVLIKKSAQSEIPLCG